MANAGKGMTARMALMAITSSSSIKVKPRTGAWGSDLEDPRLLIPNGNRPLKIRPDFPSSATEREPRSCRLYLRFLIIQWYQTTIQHHQTPVLQIYSAKKIEHS